MRAARIPPPHELNAYNAEGTLSPDGSRIVYVTKDGDLEIYTMRTDGLTSAD